jgi:hypothetical protein
MRRKVADTIIETLRASENELASLAILLNEGGNITLVLDQNRALHVRDWPNVDLTDVKSY